ncbi:MAG: glycoside hydrolase family 43 protein [Bacillota bacterium]|jgi:hypothetical protein|nr:glycoside hydrolase family 43 protein [Bacillota bacterium]
MKLKAVLFTVLALLAAYMPVCFADNPIVQTVYTSDPAPMVHDGILYVYTGHDEPGSTYYTMNDWRLYSTTDMVNWTDHGAVFAPTEFVWAKPGDAWAAQCIERDGKFYFYVTATHKTLNRPTIGVAVADSPAGPFVDPIGRPLIAHAWGDIDPTVFIDDDGQAYLYWGNPNLYYVKLNEDMVSYDRTVGIVRVPLTEESFGKRYGDPDRATLYEEGPWLYKRNGIYYLIYAASGIPENICYSTSDSPTGPWKFRRVIMPTEGRSFTNHPGIVDYKGRTYFFYHNGALPGGSGFTRSVCVEEFEFTEDGLFPTIRMSKEGPQAIANLDPYTQVEAETIAWSSGVQTELCLEGGMNVWDLQNGDYIKVKNVDFGPEGAAAFSARVASGSNGGVIELRLDSLNGEVVGTLPVSYTGGWDVWATKTTVVSGARGVHDLFFVFKGNEDELFKFNYWQFTKAGHSAEPVAISAAADQYKIDVVESRNTAKITVTAVYADGSSRDVTHECTMTVDQDGIVAVADGTARGIGYGDAVITFGYGGLVDQLPIVVRNLEREFTVKKLFIDQTAFDLYVGTSATFTVTAEYLDGRMEDVTNTATYRNPNPGIAQVSKGTITARSAGEINVVISFQGKMGEPAVIELPIAVANRNPYVQNEAEFYSLQSGVQTEDCTEGGLNVGYIENGDWIMFKSVEFPQGAARFMARVASATSGGTIEIRLGNPNGTVVGLLTVGGTGGWQNWVTRSAVVDDIRGVHDLYLKFTGGSGYLLNINWWQFEPAQ